MEEHNRISELRRARGMTQGALADAVSTTRPQIGNLESGKRQLTQNWMRKLSLALGCKPGDLLVASDVSFRLDGPETELVGFWRTLSDQEKSRALSALNAFFQHDKTNSTDAPSR